MACHGALSRRSKRAQRDTKTDQWSIDSEPPHGSSPLRGSPAGSPIPLRALGGFVKSQWSMVNGQYPILPLTHLPLDMSGYFC